MQLGVDSVARGEASAAIVGAVDYSTDYRDQAAFARLRTLAERLQAQGLGLDTLSMGMSADLEAAIAEGATIVRVGTALFGPREPHPTDARGAGDPG